MKKELINEYYKKETKRLIAMGYPRMFARSLIKQAINNNYIMEGKFTKNNLRKTRRSRSKRLKVPFRPLYNGPVYKVKWERNDNGKYTKTLIEI